MKSDLQSNYLLNIVNENDIIELCINLVLEQNLSLEPEQNIFDEVELYILFYR